MSSEQLPWTSADYWFTEFLDRLDQSKPRRLNLLRERVVVPEKDQAARDYDLETEQMRRMIAVERGRQLAEREKTA